MDTCILTLRPTNERAGTVVRGHLKKRVLLQDDPPALAFHLDEAGNFHFGRAEFSDVVLTHPKCSAKHAFISVNDDGTPTFHDTSSNGTKIGKDVKQKAVKLEDGMSITIAKASFIVDIPRRGALQPQYERNAKQATLPSALKALEALPLTSESTNTVLQETVGPYKTMSTVLDRSKFCYREVGQIGETLYILKRFKTIGLAAREHRAWKVMQGNERKHPNIDTPLSILQFLDSPIVVVNDFHTPMNVRVYYEKEPRIPRKVAACIMTQLLKALKFLHELRIIHCNVKPENLTIASEEPFRIKLTGFEMSAVGDEVLIMAAGSPPELWEKGYRGSVGGTIWEDTLAAQGYSAKWPSPFCSKPVDIWSAGAVCSELTLRKCPKYVHHNRTWRDADAEAAKYVQLMIASYEKSAESPETWTQKLNLPFESTSPALLKFLQKLLHLDPRSRSKVEDCLGDPWLTTEDHDSQVTA